MSSFSIPDTVANVVTGILVLGALFVLGLLVRQEWRTDPSPAPSSEAPSTEAVEAWRTVAETATPRSGAAPRSADSAQVTIVKVTDYECPFCRKMHDTLARLRDTYPSAVTVRYLHFPLQRHPQARLAAAAAECAARQGRLSRYHDLLFARPEQVEAQNWTQLARAAGVSSLDDFSSCLANEQTAGVVDRHEALARRIGIRTVPSVIVEGTMVTGTTSLAALKRLVDAHLAPPSAAADSPAPDSPASGPLSMRTRTAR